MLVGGTNATLLKSEAAVFCIPTTKLVFVHLVAILSNSLEMLSCNN